MFGYVITNNNIGTESGFWCVFPRLVVWMADLQRKYYGKIGKNGNYRWSWDYMTLRMEIAHRRMMRASAGVESHPDYMTF